MEIFAFNWNQQNLITDKLSRLHNKKHICQIVSKWTKQRHQHNNSSNCWICVNLRIKFIGVFIKSYDVILLMKLYEVVPRIPRNQNVCASFSESHGFTCWTVMMHALICSSDPINGTKFIQTFCWWLDDDTSQFKMVYYLFDYLHRGYLKNYSCANGSLPSIFKRWGHQSKLQNA